PQTDVTVTGSAANDNMVVEDLGGGMMRVRSGDVIPTFESVQFQTPSHSLTVNGGAGIDQLSFVGPGGVDVDSTGPITAANAGTVNALSHFTSIEKLKGGSGADRFMVNVGGSISSGIDGGAGDDTIFGPEEVNSWTITGSNAGTLNKPAGSTNFV